MKKHKFKLTIDFDINVPKGQTFNDLTKDKKNWAEQAKFLARNGDLFGDANLRKNAPFKDEILYVQPVNIKVKCGRVKS